MQALLIGANAIFSFYVYHQVAFECLILKRLNLNNHNKQK